MDEIDAIIETVDNQADGREQGCLSMRSERLLASHAGRMRAGLQEIVRRNLGDCPASMDEAAFARAHSYAIRRLARDALLPTISTPERKNQTTNGDL